LNLVVLWTQYLPQCNWLTININNILVGHRYNITIFIAKGWAL
jgi:hypothetical protein